MSTSLPTLRADEEYQIASPAVLLGDPTVSNGDNLLPIDAISSATISMNPSKQMASDVGGHQQAAAVFDRGVNPEITLEIDDAQQRVIGAMMTSAEIPNEEASITSVDTSADEFTVGSEVADYFATGDTFTVTGSSGNDGQYTVDTASNGSGSATIGVQESIDDGTADGKVIGITEGLLFHNEIQKIDPPSLTIIPRQKRENAISRAGVFHIPAVVDTDVSDFMWEDNEGEDSQNPIEYTMTALRREYDQNGDPIPEGAQMAFSVPPAELPSNPLSWNFPSPYDAP
jgi:hypothetical protein